MILFSMFSIASHRCEVVFTYFIFSNFSLNRLLTKNLYKIFIRVGITCLWPQISSFKVVTAIWKIDENFKFGHSKKYFLINNNVYISIRLSLEQNDGIWTWTILFTVMRTSKNSFLSVRIKRVYFHKLVQNWKKKYCSYYNCNYSIKTHLYSFSKINRGFFVQKKPMQSHTCQMWQWFNLSCWRK